MSDATVDELRTEVLRIEGTIDDGSYRPGPWAAVLRQARRATVEQRQQISEDVSRVGNKLHRMNWGGPTVSVKAGLAGELFAFVVSVSCLWYGAQNDIAILAIAGAFVLSWVAQPTLKMLVGTLVGVRYAYFYIKYGIEPRVRMQYGTYLVLPWYTQAVFHATGTVGSVATIWIAWAWLAPTHAVIGTWLFWIGVTFAGMNASLVLGGFFGIKAATRLSSGGQSADLVARNLFGLRQPRQST